MTRKLLTGLLLYGLVGAVSAQLVVGIDETFDDPIYMIDVVTDVATPLFADHAVWGMTADDPNRVLYSCRGDELYRIPYDTLEPNFIGFLMEGVHFRSMAAVTFKPGSGMLYGTRISGNEGVFEIDPATAEVTMIFDYDDLLYDFTGFEYDPQSDTFYGLNDDLDAPDGRGLYAIDPVAETISLVVAYPVGEIDLDGLAIGDGKAYFVPDQFGFIYVFDLSSRQFDCELTAPFICPDATFSGAAWAPGLLQPRCLGDLDNDLDVDLSDLVVQLSNFGRTNCPRYQDGNIDGDGDVDLTDLVTLLSEFGKLCD